MPGYNPKVPSNTALPTILQAFHPPPHIKADDERLNLLCSVKALMIYFQRSSRWQKSDYIVQDISLACQVHSLPSQLAMRAHSTRGMVPSRALLSGALIQEVCDAAGWATPHTLMRFYILDLPSAPGARELSS